MKRTTHVTNRWREVGWDEVRDARYGEPYRAANALAIGTIAVTEPP